MNEVKTKKVWYKRWWAFLIYGFIILSTIGSLGDAKEKAQVAAQARQEGTLAPAAVEAQAIKVTAAQMYADYKENEIAGDAKYKGKLIEVTGTVTSISKDILNTPYIALKTEEYGIFQVQCMFSKSDEAQLAIIAKGSRITLRGTVTGKLGNIIVNDCSIVK